METKKLTFFISIACAIAIICNGVVLLVLYTDLRSNQTGIGNITVTEIQRTAQTSFQTYVKENEGETTKLQTLISELVTNLTSETTKLQTRISDLETDLEKNEGETKKLRTRCEGETTKLKTRISVLETGSTKLETDLASETTKLKTRISGLETGSTKLETDVTKNEGETTNLQTRISVLETVSTKLKTDVAKNEGETTKLKTRISDLETGSRRCSLPSNVKGAGYSSRKNEFMNNEVVNLSCLDSTYAPSGTSSYTCKNGQFDPTITFKCTKLRYTLKRTPSTGTFDQAITMCTTMGGRLMQECLYKDVAGYNYENEIKSLCSSNNCWIGAKYISSNWNYLNMAGNFPGCKCSDVTGLVANWGNGEVADSSGAECANIYANSYGYIWIYDDNCSYKKYGICEIRT